MLYYADFHLHSKYSRAVSQAMSLEGLVEGARQKGLKILGTGDFSHPSWFKELKQKLKPAESEGLFVLDGFEQSGVYFVLTNEVSSIISTPKGVKKVHHLLHCPSLETISQINDLFEKKGNLEADGRPTFGNTFPSEIVDAVESVDKKDSFVIPAHCLLPDSKVHVNKALKKIQDIAVGDLVYTHKNRWKPVKEILTRPYSGKLVKITPFYFREGLSTTPEHPFFAIKTSKCRWTNGVSRPTCSCTSKACKDACSSYQPEWIRAKDLVVGDVLVYPRFSKISDVQEVKLTDYVDAFEDGETLKIKGSRSKKLPKTIPLNEKFCRLAGYYVSEGSINSNNDSISFTFNTKEKEYANDVRGIMLELFNVTVSKEQTKPQTYSVELIFYSKILAEFFKRLFYRLDDKRKRADSKELPEWMLDLPPKNQAEILRGWWRGDGGYNTSCVLANQMKLICLRLGIIPSIAIQTANKHNLTKHLFRERLISAKNNLFHFSSLSFFENKYRLLQDFAFKKFNTKRKTRHGWLDENYAYLPIREITHEPYAGSVYNLEVEDDNSYVTEWAAVHNCWTPWFSVFGSMSGFNSLKEAYEDKSKSIFAIETGLSSDPAMNWRVSALDEVSLVSNSDAHSNHPWRLGRECNAFEFGSLPSFLEIRDSIKTRKNFAFTVEVNPSYGKYHYDGHRNCSFSCPPEETKKLKGICPVCKRPLTIGVLDRVEELADRPEGFVPDGAVPFKTVLPLHELLSAFLGSPLYSKKLDAAAAKFLGLGSELSVLLEASSERLLEACGEEKIVEAILLNREGKIKVKPGFDGEYGIPILGSRTETKAKGRAGESSGQKSLGEF